MHSVVVFPPQRVVIHIFGGFVVVGFDCRGRVVVWEHVDIEVGEVAGTGAGDDFPGWEVMVVGEEFESDHGPGDGPQASSRPVSGGPSGPDTGDQPAASPGSTFGPVVDRHKQRDEGQAADATDGGEAPAAGASGAAAGDPPVSDPPATASGAGPDAAAAGDGEAVLPVRAWTVRARVPLSSERMVKLAGVEP
ncbi:MAG: hypothetical protein L0G94_15555, partial [Brachybacterium sp.]|nr:hypothetical protein [Brachybacterium sp.]